MGWLLNYSGNFVLAYDCFSFGVFFFSIFLFLLGLKFRLNSQHVQVYDDIWMLIILYPIDFRIIFSKFLLQPGPPKCSFLATPLLPSVGAQACAKIPPAQSKACPSPWSLLWKLTLISAFVWSCALENLKCVLAAHVSKAFATGLIASVGVPWRNP